MQSNQANVFARPDTLLGVCEALGEDFRINPIFLRVPLAALLIFYPVAVLGTYAAGAVLVVISRLLAPNPRGAKVPALSAPVETGAEAAPRRGPAIQDEAEAYAVAA